MRNKNSNYTLIILSTLIILVSFLGCTRDPEDLGIASYPTTAEVFIDGFSAGMDYEAFGESKTTAFEVDEQIKYKGSASMRFDVPNADDPAGGFAAGYLFSEPGRDLSGYTALTFWAKASQSASIDEIGFGFTFAEEKYRVSVNDLNLNTAWTKYVIPIPDASKLKREKGLLYYIDEPDNGSGYSFWLDEVKFEDLGTIANMQPYILDGNDETESTVNNSTIQITGFGASFNLPNGANQQFKVAAAYFQFSSSETDVATVNSEGAVTVLSEGTALITAKIKDVDADGSLTINSTGNFVHAPVPTRDAADVISLFSNAYTDVPVDYYNGFWAPFQTTLSADFTVDGDDVLYYTNLNFVGIQFTDPVIDASNMTHLHLDIWLPNEVSPTDQFLVRVLDLGPDGGFGDPDPSISATFTSPDPLVSQNWISLDLSLADLPSKDKLAQIIFENLGSPLSAFYADNIYFYKEGGGTGDTEPTEPAPDPTHDAENVISVYSDAYTNIDIAELNPNWGQSGTVIEQMIAGNNTLKYENFNFQGTQFAMAEDLSGMEYVHIDMWTVDATDVKFTPISGSGEFLVGLTPITPGQWMSYDIPLSDFTGMTFNDVMQLKFDGNGGVTPANLWLDNIYFYKEGGGATEPTEPAPDPTHDAANVISVYSDVYTNIDIAELNPNWGQSGTVIEQMIAGNNTLKYENFNYQGTQFAMAEDMSEMEYVHIDMWTADATDVKFTPISGSGEFLVGLTPITQGQWVSYDIPLSDFTGMTFNDVMQLKFDGNGGVTPANLWLDNIYFYKEGGGATEPTEPAPDPTHDAKNVISVYSDVYMNIDIAELNPNWGQSGTVIEQMISGNNTLKYENFNYQGTQFAMAEDMSEMEYVHIDMWTADATDVKFTPISGSGEFLVGLTPITQGQWVSYDIPLSDFTGMTFNDVMQLKFDGNGGVTPANLWLDNIYFYKEGGGATEPTEPAPDPTHDAVNVISVYSDAYTNIDIAELNPNWGQSGTVIEQMIAGNNTLKYENFNYQGTQFAMAEDMSEMEYVHIDMWTADATDVKFTPISGSGEFLVGLTPITQGQWVSYDIPLSDFTGMTFNDVMQLKFDGNGGVTPANLWLDNIYFYKEGGGGGNYTIDDPIDFEPSGFGADWTWTVFENDTNPPVEIVANPDPSGPNTSSTVAKFTALQSGNPWTGCETMHGTDFTTFTLDASNAIVKIMVYKPVISDVGLKFVLPSGEALGEIKVPNTLVNQWEELTFDFSSRIGHPSTVGQDQIVVFPDFDLSGRTSDNVVYFDNITFGPN